MLTQNVISKRTVSFFGNVSLNCPAITDILLVYNGL